MAAETVNINTFITVTQAGHGFAAKNAVYRASGSYALAKADAINTSKVAGIVASVIDANTFRLAIPGHTVSGLSGFTDGQIQYLSDSVAGGLTTTIPTSPSLAVPVAIATSSTSIIVCNILGHLVFDPLTQDRPDHQGGDLTFHYFGAYDTGEARSERVDGGALKSWLAADFIQDGDTLTTGLTFPNAGLHLEDIPGDNTLTIVANEDLTGDRNLKIIVNDATRILTVAGDATISGTNTGDQTNVSGNAGTATALQTSRNIDGQAFDGTANITVIAPGTHAATSKATPVDADELPLVDSAASNVLKKLTWANLKATLKTYFDTLYQTIITFGTGVQTALGNAVNTASGFVTQTGGDARYAPISPITYLSYASGSQAFTSTSLADVNGTSFTLGVGSYDIEWRITHDAAATTTGAFFSVNGTAVFTTGELYGKVLYRCALTENPYKPFIVFDGGVTAATSFNTINNNAFVIVHIKVTTGGTILLRAATEVGASAITITDVHGYAQKKD